MDNISMVYSENTSVTDWRNVHVLTYSFGVLSTCWTILANAVIMICFYRTRGQAWTRFTRQTCSMTVSDLLVGVTSIPLLVLEQNGGVLNGVLCVATMYMFIATQCVTMYHVLGICILRNISMNSISEQHSDRNDRSATNKMIAVSWTFSLIVILIPFAVWSTAGNEEMLCYLDGLFDNNLRLPSLYIATTFFVSQCFTNILYIITCYRFSRIIRKTAPPQNQNGAQSFPMTSQSNNIMPQSTSLLEGNRKQATITNNGNDSQVDTTLPCTSHSQQMMSAVKKQKRIIGTIGILLLLFNVFTLPLTTLLYFEGPRSTNRNVRFIIWSLFLINSAINPIVYATRVAALRGTVKQLFKDVFAVCGACN